MKQEESLREGGGGLFKQEHKTQEEAMTKDLTTKRKGLKMTETRWIISTMSIL